MNTPPFNDETLSAFLDAELPEHEMELIRNALMNDDDLAARLANLAMVDEVIAQQYEQINETPLPNAVQALLAKLPEQQETTDIVNKPKSNNVVSFRKKIKQSAPIAFAASFAGAIGFSAALFLSEQSNHPDNWPMITQVLEQESSGFEKTLPTGQALLPKFSFTNKQGQFCRQFDLIKQQTTEHNVACRVNEHWQLTLKIVEERSPQYQTATSNNLLHHHIDNTIQGDFLSQQQEQQAIKQHWQ